MTKRFASSMVLAVLAMAALPAQAQTLGPDPAQRRADAANTIQQQSQATQMNSAQLQSQLTHDQIQRDRLFTPQQPFYPVYPPVPFPGAQQGGTPFR